MTTTFTKSGSPQEIVPGIFLGDQYDAMDADHLRELHIGAVLNCALFNPKLRSLYKNELPELVYEGFPIEDEPRFPIQQYFMSTNRFIDHARRRGLRVLVHCQAGISRSVTVLCAYLMNRFGWSMAKALKQITRKRPIAHPNPGFINALVNYENVLARYI